VSEQPLTHEEMDQYADLCSARVRRGVLYCAQPAEGQEYAEWVRERIEAMQAEDER
jgi:hypothetical protein